MDKFYTPEELAALLKLHRMTIYRRSLNGEIPGRIKVGGAVRFRQSAIDRWLRRGDEREVRSEALKEKAS